MVSASSLPSKLCYLPRSSCLPEPHFLHLQNGDDVDAYLKEIRGKITMQSMWWCLTWNGIPFPSIYESFQIDKLLSTLSAQLKYPLIIKPVQTSRWKCLMPPGHIMFAPTTTVKGTQDSHQLLECQAYPIRRQLGAESD